MINQKKENTKDKLDKMNENIDKEEKSFFRRKTKKTKRMFIKRKNTEKYTKKERIK